jgi:hypothetical protein
MISMNNFFIDFLYSNHNIYILMNIVRLTNNSGSLNVPSVQTDTLSSNDLQINYMFTIQHRVIGNPLH